MKCVTSFSKKNTQKNPTKKPQKMPKKPEPCNLESKTKHIKGEL